MMIKKKKEERTEKESPHSYAVVITAQHSLHTAPIAQVFVNLHSP